MAMKIGGVGVIVSAAIAALWLALASTGTPAVMAQHGGQPVTAYTLFPAQRLEDQTAHSRSPNPTSTGFDITRIADYDTADLYITAIGEPGFSLTTTVEFSPDGVSWAPLTYEYWTGYRIATVGVNRLQTESGTIYHQVQTAGVFLRVRLDASGVVTPTVRAIYKNIVGTGNRL
jgi:hypothetical protein